MRLFKGAYAGSHWHQHHARLSGFTSSPGTKNVDSIVAHITNYSYPSPYLSFTASPAIARGYALPVGWQRAGRIYEIDTTNVDLELYDPLHEIASAYGKLAKFKGHAWATHHDGDAGLISALADGHVPRSPVPHRRRTQRFPQFAAHLQAVVLLCVMLRS